MSNVPWTTRSSMFGDMPRAELAAGHPGSQDLGALYHGVEHTLRVERFAFQMAARCGCSGSEARFLATVALVHDWDPGRPPGTPARVSATLLALETDFNWRRFGWTLPQYTMALAIIQRTDFPFDEAKRGLYIQRIERIMSRTDRRFVIEKAPLISEYADKGSFYTAAPFRSAFAAVKGLVQEMTAFNMTIEKLNTPGFLRSIGIPKAFEHDIYVAEYFGFQDLAFPEASAILTQKQQARLDAFGKGFQAFTDATGKGADPASAYRTARAAVLQALRAYRR